MKATNITNYYYSDKLFNYFCLTNDTNEIPLEDILTILKKCVHRYL